MVSIWNTLVWECIFFGLHRQLILVLAILCVNSNSRNVFQHSFPMHSCPEYAIIFQHLKSCYDVISLCQHVFTVSFLWLCEENFGMRTSNFPRFLGDNGLLSSDSVLSLDRLASSSSKDTAGLFFKRSVEKKNTKSNGICEQIKKTALHQQEQSCFIKFSKTWIFCTTFNVLMIRGKKTEEGEEETESRLLSQFSCVHLQNPHHLFLRISKKLSFSQFSGHLWEKK